MKIETLSLTNFRNYSSLKVCFNDGINVITGKNAQGKTNLLEAVSYLTSAKSFRGASDKELIEFGKTETRLEAEIFSDGRSQKLDLEFGLIRRKKIMVNEVRQKTAAGLSGKLTAVLFSPEDLSIIQSSPLFRRRLLDNCLCQIRPRYAECLTEYRRLYDSKTKILRDGDKRMLPLLEEYNERMCENGSVILHYRAHLIKVLSDLAGEIHNDFSGETEKLTLSYQTVKTVENPLKKPLEILPLLRKHMAAHQDAELAAARCLSGIHKDDVLITINDRDSRKYASQGQARTAAISLKLAEREIIKRDSGEYPILLLDDVLSELDGGRQDYILNRIGNGQVMITCCEDKSIAKKTGGRVLLVHQGIIQSEEHSNVY